MAENLELKAVVSSLSEMTRIASKLGASYRGEWVQKDTYFDVGKGRLKLRENGKRGSELIWYTRPNRKGARYSRYRIARLKHPGEFLRVLRVLWSVMTVVHKRRRLYFYKNARIHLDRVKGLGDFLEFEVMVRKGKPQAEALMRFLRVAFQVRSASLVRWSYSDLMELKRRGS